MRLGFRTIALVAALAACSEDVPPPEQGRATTIDAGTFASALSDLVVARIELLPDTAAYHARAAEILAARGISPDDLDTFARVHGQNDDLMTRAYARVEARLDSLYPPDRPAAPIETPLDSAAP